MDHYIEKIQKAVDEGDHYEALRSSNRVLLSSNPERLSDERKKFREAVIEIFHGSGVFEKMLAMEEADLKEGGKNFSVIYELYKFEIHAFGKVSLRVMEGMTLFYENRDDRMTSIGLSETLRDQYKEEGREEMLEEAQNRVAKNIQLLHEKAVNYQKTGEHRYAFNSYRCLLECDFKSYDYHLGYLVNAIKSGKPKEAYNTILEDKSHRDYIMRDETLKNHFYDLSHVVAADEKRPDVLQ